jgi:sec-independent protein translocase protein TatB
MFDLGWSELLLIAVIAIIVVGPRDLPRMMRTVGQYVTKARRMARDLQSQFNDALREADLDDVGKEIGDLGRMNPARQIRDGLTKPLKSVGDDLKRAADGIEAGANGERRPAAEPEREPETPQTAPPQPAATDAGGSEVASAPAAKPAAENAGAAKRAAAGS